ncbi:MAG: hypothetical protein ABSH05_24875 [Bryobacteraceae bacterium]
MRASLTFSFCMCLPAFAATVATVRPELEVLPATIELPSPKIPTDVVLVLRNPSDRSLNEVNLSWIASDEFAVTANSPLKPGTLPPYAESAWRLRVSRTNEDVVPGALHFRIDYTTLIQGRPTKQILLRSVKVTTREREPAEKFLDVQVATSLETLESSRDGSLNLLFTNKTGRPVVIEKVTPNYPDFLNLELATEPRLSISPYGTARQGYVVKAKDRVVPGKYLLVFDIQFRSAEGGVTADRTMVASREVTVGVLGESAISKAVGLGSFLLAPGWLFIVTAGLMFRTGLLRRKVADEKLLLEINTPEFWLVAVAISLLFAVVAKLFTKQWYFVRYGLEDIVWVWMISIGFGALSYISYMAVEATKRRKEAARTPSERDTPVVGLKKLAAQGLPLVLDRVTLKGKGDKPGFLIQKDGKDSDPAWVSPAILIRYADIPEEDGLRERVKQMTSETSPAELAGLLQRCPRAVAWDSEPIPGPRKVRKEDRTDVEADIIVGEAN